MGQSESVIERAVGGKLRAVDEIIALLKAGKTDQALGAALVLKAELTGIAQGTA